MLRQDAVNSNRNGNQPRVEPQSDGGMGVLDIQRELNRLEEMLLDSPRVPLSRRTMIDEDEILDHLDAIRINLPQAFQDAVAIIQQKQAILDEAEQYAQDVMAAAEQRAAQMMNESGVLRQAELEANQLRQRVQQECEAAQTQTLEDIDRTRRQAQQEFEAMRRQAIAERDQIVTDADTYADQVLQGMEQQLTEIMRIVKNGRQQLKPVLAPQRNTQALPQQRTANPQRSSSSRPQRR